MAHYELTFIGPAGADVWCYGHQPTTDDIAERAFKKTADATAYTHCVQQVGTVYEVYALRTLRKMTYHGSWTIGLPICTHEDYDAAVMFATLQWTD
jgi:hypothetical protein